MKVFDKLKSSTLWLMIPSFVLAGMIGVVVMGYEPLMFDPSLLESKSAQAANLKQTSAEEAGSGEPAGTPAPAGAANMAKAPSDKELADGTWTGYAPCGKGNGDGWKPYYVAVTIQVKDGKVVKIADVKGTSKADSGAKLNWDAAENQSYLSWAVSGRAGTAGVVSQINKMLSSGKSVAGIDTVSSATYSSAAIYNAYVAAVNKAAAAAGKAQKQKPQKEEEPKKEKEKAQKPAKVQSEDAADLGTASFADGTWTGYAPCGQGNDEDWKPYYVAVTIEVEGGVVKAVSKIAGSSTGDSGDAKLNWDEAENQAYLNWAANGRTRSGVAYTGVLAQLEKAMSAGANPTSIDAVSGATYSSQAIFQAYYAALKKSAAAGGATVDDPETPVLEPDPEGPDPGETGSDDPDNPTDPSGDSGDDPGDVPGDDSTEDALVDGTYSGYAFCEDGDNPSEWGAYYIFVTIEVENGKVARIADIYADDKGEVDPRYVYDASENSVYLNKAVNDKSSRTKGMKSTIQAKIDAGADTSDISTVSGATWSSKAILQAYANAVENAKAAS